MRAVSRTASLLCSLFAVISPVAGVVMHIEVAANHPCDCVKGSNRQQNGSPCPCSASQQSRSSILAVAWSA